MARGRARKTPARLVTRIILNRGSASRTSAKGPGRRSAPKSRTVGPRATTIATSAITRQGHRLPARAFPCRRQRRTAPRSDETREHESGEQVVGADRPERVGDLAVEPVPGAGGQKGLERRRVVGRLGAAALVALRAQGGPVHQVERHEGEGGERGREEGRAQEPPSSPEQDEERGGQDGERDHAVVAAGVEGQDEEERGQERVRGLRRSREAHGEQHHQGKPLRPQRGEMGDLVRADGRESEGRAGEEGDPLPRPEAPRQQEGGEPGNDERQQAGDVVQEHRVIGEGCEGQDEERRAQDGLVHAPACSAGGGRCCRGGGGRDPS